MTPVPTYERVIFQPGGPRRHFACDMALIARRSGCEYRACVCGARKVIIEPGARPEPGWVTRGDLPGQVVELRQAELRQLEPQGQAVADAAA